MAESHKQAICLLLSGPPIGGFRSFVINLSSFLRSHSYEVELCFLSSETWAFRDDISVFSIFNCRSVSSLKAKDMPLLFRVRLAIRFFIARVRHRLFKNKKNALLVSLLGSQKRAAESVLHEGRVYDFSKYDCVISTEEIRCNYFLSHNIIAQKKIGFIHPDYLLAHFDKVADYPFLKNLDAVCAVCASSRKSLEKAFPRLKASIYGLRTPLDVKKIISLSQQPLPASHENGSFDFLTVCRLDNSS